MMGCPPHLQGATDEARRHAEEVADTAKEKYSELKVGCCRLPSLCVCCPAARVGWSWDGRTMLSWGRSSASGPWPRLPVMLAGCEEC